MESGASYKHFTYLLNGSIILHRLSPSDRSKVAWGTTGNEALHNQIKGVASTTVQQHATRVCTRMKAFAIGKLLAHNAAAYSPSTHKQIEGDVLCTIQGALVAELLSGLRNVTRDSRDLEEGGKGRGGLSWTYQFRRC